MDARKAFVGTLSDADRTKQEDSLAQALEPLWANALVIGGYCAMGSEISPLRALEAAFSGGATVAYPAFRNPAKPFRFHAGDPLECGPFGIMQPDPAHPEVQPDLVLVPLVAIDPGGTRLGRGKGHYDRSLARLRKSGARLVGVGWQLQRLTETIPADPWDVPLDAFASPEGLEWFGQIDLPFTR